MKKIKLLVFFLFLLSINTICVNARVNSGSEWIHKEYIDDHSHLAVCSYQYNYVYHGMTDESRYLRINIYYKLSDGTWRVSWDDKSTLNYDYSSSGSSSYKDKFGKYDSVFSTKGTNIIIDNNSKQNLEQGICPEGAWIVTNGFTDRVCFGSKEACKAKSEDSSERNYDINEQINTYFQKWYPTINSCETLRSKNFNIKEQLLLDFKTNFLYGNEIPKFINTNQTYENGFKSLTTIYENLKNRCDNEVKENENLTDKEKEDLLDQNNKGLNEAINQINDYKQETNNENNVIQNTTSSADIGNFCNEPRIQNAFRFIGYLLLIVKILIPILLIIFGTIDYAKALVSSDADAVQKSTKALITRVIAGVAIFLIPTIVNFAFRLVWNADTSFNNCRVCIFDPKNCGE